MKYINAHKILPKDIIKVIQEYVDGEYLYIPRREEEQKRWGEESGSREALKRRNIEIYDKYLKGAKIIELSEEYYLSDKSIRRIISDQKKFILKTSGDP
ncbi:hypothetical protein SDC9_106420 [bioreactor metagenome]|uniref:Mor transcription activator domain-containing protein n=1 Tax=bioreactor metagenome TaxID=1076179 RepID=A0A645B3C0_9ZZZZ